MKIGPYFTLLLALPMAVCAQSAQAPSTQSTPAPIPQSSSALLFAGAIADSSGASISDAMVLVRTAKSALQATTRSDRSGSFILTGLSPGPYRLIVSHPGFETREIAITLGTTESRLRISLAIQAVATSIDVKGRADDLIGIADSATQGTVGASEIQDRPILRSGEVLETVPGLIITQHAGGGKANQYFLRGFNLDHGTDFAIFIDDMPLNLPSHAHGEGYADMNTVIPEFVKRVDFEKGPYYADVGNYGSAGSARLIFFQNLPQNFFKVEGGMYGYGRAVFGASQKLGLGSLLYGGEAFHDDGPWTHPDNYYKFNGLLTYSQGEDANGFSITSRAYRGTWHSSDQLPDSAVPLVGFFGALNPTDGGHSQRYSLQGEWHRGDASSETKITAYGFYYDLNLFSDFTYYLDDPVKGDQFEQQDRRWVAGIDAHHSILSEWHGHKMANTFGLQVRNDWIHNGLYRTKNRVRTDKTDVAAPDQNDPDEPNNNGYAILPAATDLNRFTDTLVGFYFENKIQWSSKFRSEVAMRGDDEKFVVTSLTPNEFGTNFAAANSGSASKFLPQPKASLIFGPWSNTEFYAQGGFSFHSNDGRGATQTIEPISPDFPYPNTPVAKIAPLVQTKGGEFGARTTVVPHLQSTVSVWYLRSNSELEQDGDTGGTVPSEQSSNRYGIEWANFYTPTGHLSLDFDFANSRAQFTRIDPDDAAFSSNAGQLVQGPGGKRVPEAVGTVISAGATLHDYKNLTASLRLRNFGPRDLTSDGIYRSRATVLLNAEVRYQIGERWHITAELLNLLNRRDHDIDYAYTSQITPTASPAFTDVFHPVEPIQVRFALGRSF